MSSPESTTPRTAATPDYEAAINDIADEGIAAIRGTRTGAEQAVSEIGETGREALQGARDVRDIFADAVLTSIKVRPYTTLVIAGLIGFAYGAFRRH